ncbi:MAG: ABC transporter substrate-binding protein [Alphaproteobacteria bacterium]|nr:ABC transporter substrate-binding protein [Alphaproteobacteria bacterium]
MAHRALRIAAFLAAATCAAAPSLADKASDTLNIAWNADPQTIDPYQGATREGNIIVHHVFDALLFRDPDTSEYKPALATAYRWVDDTTLEFDLRRGVKFHNGDPFSAEDVVFTFNTITKKDFPIILRSLADWIKGAEKIDDYKVRVTLNKPFPAALEYFSLPLRIYPKAYFEKVGAEQFTRAPVGTGPYKVVELVAGKSIVLERFDDHYAGSPKGRPAIKRLNMRVMPEMATQIAELMTGGLDWTWRVTPDQAAKLAGRGNLVSLEAETMRFSLLSFDAAARAGKSPMQDLRVRRAFAHAINRQELRDNLVKGASRVIHSGCYPTQFGCTDDVVKYDYDPAKAKALLAEAGYPDGFEITLLSYGGTFRIESEAVVNYMRAVGVRINPQMLQSPTVRQKMSNSEAQLVHMHWGSDSVNDVARSAGQYFDFSPYDMARDPQVRDWLLEAQSTTDSEKRKAAYKKALQRIAEQVYWLPMTTFVTNYTFVNTLDFKPSYDEYPRFFFARWK